MTGGLAYSKTGTAAIRYVAISDERRKNTPRHRDLSGPHEGRPVLKAGTPLEKARAAMILAHGRGASAADIMTVAAELSHPDVAYLAPEAAGSAWYPHPFTAPLEANEPFLSSALSVLEKLLLEVTRHVPQERVILLGFSQGACLTLEFAARHAGRYGGVIAFSGGLIGPDGTPRDYPGSFEHTPVFIGCSDVDPHIAKDRVVEAGEVLKKMGAQVTVHLYPGMGHTVNADELHSAAQVLEAVAHEVP
jgi:predicted esterase